MNPTESNLQRAVQPLPGLTTLLGDGVGRHSGCLVLGRG
jgi:hypothetical protein